MLVLKMETKSVWKRHLKVKVVFRKWKLLKVSIFKVEVAKVHVFKVKVAKVHLDVFLMKLDLGLQVSRFSGLYQFFVGFFGLKTCKNLDASLLMSTVVWVIFMSWCGYEAYVSKYRLLYMVVSEPIKSFVGYLRKGNTGWELIHIPFCTLL